MFSAGRLAGPFHRPLSAGSPAHRPFAKGTDVSNPARHCADSSRSSTTISASCRHEVPRSVLTVEILLTPPPSLRRSAFSAFTREIPAFAGEFADRVAPENPNTRPPCRNLAEFSLSPSCAVPRADLRASRIIGELPDLRLSPSGALHALRRADPDSCPLGLRGRAARAGLVLAEQAGRTISSLYWTKLQSVTAHYNSTGRFRALPFFSD